ncbi:MAG: COX15/CtaA family protein [Deltaproteobacteria bacterium]|nr:COX15/CtaA family protein [Deltaproteobacteria bacterium]
MREYRFTQATAVAVFLLLLVGGLVNPTGSSLACPDWPLCYGSAFPDMKGGILYEHSHRLLATAVGVLTIIMTWLVLRARRPGTPGAGRVRLLTKIALPLVLAQGALGGVTVLLKLPMIVTLTHLVNSMFFFALVLTIAWHLSPAGAERVSSKLRFEGPGRRWIVVAGVLVIAQILLGGIVRHTKSASTCRELPLCGDSLWPTHLHPSARIHMAHRIFGVIVALVVISVAIQVYRRARKAGHVRLARLALLAPVLVLTQVTLGVLNVYFELPLSIVTAHLGGAALLFALHVWMFWTASPVAAAQRATAPTAERTGDDAHGTLAGSAR